MRWFVLEDDIKFYFFEGHFDCTLRFPLHMCAIGLKWSWKHVISIAPDRHKNRRVLFSLGWHSVCHEECKKACPTWVGCLLGGATLAWTVSDNQMQNTHISVDKAWNLRVHLCNLFGLGSKWERAFVIAVAVLYSLVVVQCLSSGETK